MISIYFCFFKKHFLFFRLLLMVQLIFTFGWSQSINGPFNPAQASNKNTIGVNAWISPGNCMTNNSVYASTSVRGITQYLQANDFNVGLTGIVEIKGIAVNIRRSSSEVQNVALLNGWTEGLTKSVSAGINRCLVVIASMETGNDVREITAMTYGGQPMTQVSNIFAVSGFYARVQVWILNEAGIAAATSTTINPTYTGTIHAEYCASISSATFINVDQYQAVSHLVESSQAPAVSTTTYQLGNPINTLTGSMSITAIMQGNRPSAAPAPGGAGGWTINSGFTTGINLYYAHASFPSSGASCLIGHKASAGIGTEQPTYTFAGSANRYAAVGFSLRRARQMDYDVRLVKGGVTVGSNYARSGIEWPTVNEYVTYGGSNDLWGTTWSMSEINSPNFGAAISAIVQNGNALIDHITITVHYNTISALPVTLLDFELTKRDQTVIINWSTATEKNNDYFTILRSQNFHQWETVKTIKGSGNSTTTRFYSITDENPLMGISYYRLKQTDFDGTVELFEPKAIEMKHEKSALLVFPNPAKDIIYISWEEKNFSVNIYDCTGKEIINTQKETETIDISKMEKGTYILKVSDGITTEVRKLIVTK